MSMSSENKPHDSSPDAKLDTKEHVSLSVYLHSEEMMAVVKELYENWREEPREQVGKLVDRSLWYYSGLLTTNPAAFVEIMSLELGLNIVFDSGREQEICFEILNALRKQRGAPTLARSF
jgi:hypothetical protein